MWMVLNVDVVLAKCLACGCDGRIFSVAKTIATYGGKGGARKW